MSVWNEIGDRVFLRRYAFYDQQIGVVVGADEVLLVDTRSSHAQAEEIRPDLRVLTPLPVGVVVNTHHHHDHTFGNHVFRPAPIWGHVRCAPRHASDGDREAARPGGRRPKLAADLPAVVIDPPDRTFEETAVVEVGGRRVELRHLGRGHTDDDIVALVPDAGVLFAGDLLENGAAALVRGRLSARLARDGQPASRAGARAGSCRAMATSATALRRDRPLARGDQHDRRAGPGRGGRRALGRSGHRAVALPGQGVA